MKIVLAQIRKDIQCQRGLLLTWAICAGLGLLPFALSLVPHCFTFPNAKPGIVLVFILSLGGMAMASALIIALGMFFLLPLLVVRIVHEDVLMGTTAFWLTRPLARKELLGAKTLLIAALLIPLLFLAGVEKVTIGTGHFLETYLALIAAFAVVAAITSGARDFMIYVVALLFAKGIFAAVFQSIRGHFHGSGIAMADAGVPPFNFFSRTLHLGAPDFYHLCYFAGFAAVFIHQYLTLRTKRSLVLMIGVIAVVSIVQVFCGTFALTPAAP